MTAWFRVDRLLLRRWWTWARSLGRHCVTLQ